jgi:hypothetical protein
MDDEMQTSATAEHTSKEEIPGRKKYDRPEVRILDMQQTEHKSTPVPEMGTAGS